jgi:hypothetical protein
MKATIKYTKITGICKYNRYLIDDSNPNKVNIYTLDYVDNQRVDNLLKIWVEIGTNNIPVTVPHVDYKLYIPYILSNNLKVSGRVIRVKNTPVIGDIVTYKERIYKVIERTNTGKYKIEDYNGYTLVRDKKQFKNLEGKTIPFFIIDCPCCSRYPV